MLGALERHAGRRTLGAHEPPQELWGFLLETQKQNKSVHSTRYHQTTQTRVTGRSAELKSPVQELGLSPLGGDGVVCRVSDVQ